MSKGSFRLKHGSKVALSKLAAAAVMSIVAARRTQGEALLEGCVGGHKPGAVGASGVGQLAVVAGKEQVEPLAGGVLSLRQSSADGGLAGATGARGVAGERPAGGRGSGMFLQVHSYMYVSMASLGIKYLAALTHVRGASMTNTDPPLQLRKGPAVTLAMLPSSATTCRLRGDLIVGSGCTRLRSCFQQANVPWC